jgi:energy-coupling factor transporter ATP-binding protein EcfA2
MQEEMLRLENFSFKYAGLETHALLNVSFSIRKGEIAVLAGPSGSGKTTLLRSVNGLIPHLYPGEYSGRVVVDGLVVHDTPTCSLARRIGFLFQNPENQIFMFSVERDVAFGLENTGVERPEILRRVDWALQLLKISELRKNSPSELSDGQKQRVAIAGALVMGAQLLVLDEPTSLLDPEIANNLVDLLRELNEELGLTILIVEHRLELVAPIADRLVVLSEGKIWKQGTPEEVLASEDIREAGLAPPTVVDLQKKLRSRGCWSDKIELNTERFSTVVKNDWPQLNSRT